MIVYLITNKVNGKKYVGKTTEPLSTRWRKHRYNASIGQQTAICRAIRKYGDKAFEVVQIVSCSNESELSEAEKMYINKYNSRDPNLGYNLTNGGDGISGWHHTEEAKQKISEASKGHKVSREQRKQVSDRHKGKVISPATRAKISASHTGKKRGSYSIDRVIAATNGLKKFYASRKVAKNHAN